MTVRQRVLNLLQDGTLSAQSQLTDVPYVGVYIEQRLRHSLALPGPVTLSTFWQRTRRRTTNGVLSLIKKALQNERSNQCVSSRLQGEEHEKAYHTSDINQYGYEAIVALLEHNRQNARYGVIPLRLPHRATGSKTCGCRPRHECNGVCRLSDDGRACVPIASRTNGFIGVVAHQSQGENVSNQANVRRASRMRNTRALRRDPDSMRDVRNRHKQTLVYDRRGARLWRRPSTRVRYPR